MSKLDLHGCAKSPLVGGWLGRGLFRPVSRSGNRWLSLVAIFALAVWSDTAQAGGWANITSAASPSGVFLGDTPTMGTIWVDQTENGNNRTEVQVYADTDKNLSSGASTGAILTGSASQSITPAAPKATATGTWYWGIRVQYTYGGGNYNAWQWSTGWLKMSFAGFPNDTTSVTLNYSVSALNNPSNVVAARTALNPTSQVYLEWAKGYSGGYKNTLILRKAGAITTDPTQGTSYSVGNTIDSATVILNNSDTNFTDTSLSPETQYYYKLYAENFNYYSSGSSLNLITLATEPASSPNNLTFGGLNTTSLALGWGNISTQVLVVVRASSDLSHDPGDSTNYTANAALGSGTALGGGSVVYKGNATNVTVTGLSADTRYYVRVYNMRGGGGTSENYRVSDELAGDRYTLANEPSGHVSAFSATPASQTQINLSWTAAAGPPTGYIILRRSGAAPTGTPVDGTGYSVGNTIGDSTVAAIVTPGSSTSANITGLSASTTYHFTIFPYNGSAAQAYNYRTAATVPSANATTLPNAPAAVTGVTASDGTNTAYVFVSWDDPIGETGTVIWRNTSAAPGSAVAIGTNDAFASDPNIYFDTSASPGQLYYYWVTATNTGGSSSMSASNTGYRKLATVTTLAATDNTYGDKVQLTWDNMSGETGYGIWRHTADSSGAATYLASTAADVVTYDDTSASPGVTYYYWVRSTNNTSLSQSDFQGSGEPGTRANATTAPSLDTPTATSITFQGATLGANITTNGGAVITSRGTVWNTTATPTANELTEGGTATGVFSHARTGMPAGTLIYFRGWASNSVGKGYSSDGQFWTIPHAPTPAAASSIAGKTFTANWSAATGATNYLLDVSSASDFSSYIAGFQSRLVGNVTTFGVTNLSENTTYYWRLRSQNSGGTSTNSVSGSTLTVPLAPVASAATNWTTSSFWANWAAASGATSYRLDVSTVNTFASFVSGWEDVNVANVVTYNVNSSLSAGSVYYYRVRAVNASGASTNSNTITAYTLSTEPTGHVGSFAAATASDTQINLSWSAAAGPPSGYLIIRRTGAAPTGTPADGQAYSVSDTIGDGTVAAIVTPGSGTSANITGLSAGTTYHFAIFPYNWNASNAQTYNYRTAATVPSASASTLATEPTTQANTILFTLIGKSTMTVNWVTGNGTDTLLVAREGSAVNANPADGTAYTANAAFGSGTQIGTGNYVVYSGTGTNVTVNGLKTNTTYHFRLYEFNGASATANYNTNTATGNPASQATLDNQPGMSNNPTAFSLTTMVGSSPSTSNFGVTNIGGGTLAYSVSTNAAWLSVSPVSGSLAAGVGQQHTITYAVSGLHAGVSNATITLSNTGTGNNTATNGPLTVAITLTLTNIPESTAVSATADGSQLIRLAWTKPASHNVMIIHRAGSAPTAPVNGTSYSAGSAAGGGTVIYTGTGGTLEHVVSAGATHYYTFHSINNNNYSTGMPVSVTTEAYPTGSVEQGGYTNGVNLSGLGGGSGWTNNWSTTGSGTWQMQTNFSDAANDIPMMPTITGYRATTGNRMMIDGLASDNTAFAFRYFSGYTSGNIYVASLVSFRYFGGGGANSRYMGVSLFSGTTEEAFIGRAGGNNVLAIDSTGSAKTESGYTINGTESGAGGSTGNVYLVVTKYDFTANKVYAVAYFRTDTVPSTEPNWSITNTPSPAITRIDGIRVGGGAYGGNNIGAMWFDEVRVASTWEEIVGAAPTYEWDAGGGSGDRSWSTAANWTANTEPVASSNAFINGGYTGVVSAAGEVAANLYVGGFSGTGRLEQTGGSLSVTNFYLGFSATNSGEYIMSGGALTVAVDMAVGFSGIATAQIHGAASKMVIGDDLIIAASNANNRAGFLHGGGTVTVNRIYIGNASATEGRYTITNGLLAVTDDIYLADGNANSTGRFVVAGNGVVTVGDEFYVGRNGQGILSVRDSGSLTLTSGSGLMIAGDLTGNNKTNIVELGGGTITVGSHIQVGDAANAYGYIVVSNGVLNSSGSIFLANIASSRAAMDILGGFVDPVSIYVGYASTGSLNISGGSVTANVFHVGSQVGSEGVMTMSGGNLMVEGTDLIIGNSGVGTLTLSGGTLRAGDGVGNTDVTLGGAAGGKGTFIHTGGTLVFDDPASSDDTDLVIGGASTTGLYILAGSGNLNASAGDDILINENGELRLIGSGWSATVDDDFTMAAGSTLGIVFSNGISRIVVDTDLTIAGTLNVSNYGSVADGSYVVVTSITRSITGTFAATNWQGGVTGSVSYANGAVHITFVTPAEIAILGTNYAVIASGDSTPSTADGTDFGNFAIAAGALSRTFFITNSGGGSALTVSGVTTSGAGAAAFTVTSWPANVPAITASNLVVAFDPSVVGLHTAVITVANSDSDEGTYTFTVQGTGTAPGISNNPTTLAVSSTLGSTPSSVGFGVTNIGTGTLAYDISTNASWLTVSPVSGSIASLAGQQHTVSFATQAGFQSGLSNATITVTGATATNGPTTVTVNWTINAIPNPSAASAVANGPEHVRLLWTKDASYNVMIVHRGGAAPTAPAQGTTYSVGGSLGGGTVIYKGAGAYLDHVISPSTTNYYAFYSYNGDFYSAGLSAAATNGVYGTGIIENFSYTNSASLHTLNGGQGWTNAWNNSGGGYGFDTSVFSSVTGYPADGGNVMTGTSSSAYREFAAVTTGKLYVAYKFRVSNGSGYAGLSFFNNIDEQIFFGEAGYAVNEFTVDGGSLNRQSGGQLANDQDYTLIGLYDFENDVAKALIYTNATESIPTTEPGSWDAQITDADPVRINRIRLESGSGTVVTKWDEIRVATSWEGLLQRVVSYPAVTNFVFNGGSDATDAQMAAGTLAVRMHLYDVYGIATTNTSNPYFIPNFDILNNLGTEILTDKVFEAFSYINSGTTVIATNSIHTGAAASAITLGTYTGRVSIVNSNGYQTLNVRTNVYGAPITFNVVDDDTAAPEVNLIQSTNNTSSRNLHISLGASQLSTASGSTTNILYTTTDGTLAGVASSGPLIFWFGARDAFSGLARSTADTATNTSFSIGSAIVSNIANYDAARSSADTTAVRPTNVWSWTVAFSGAEIDNLVTNTAQGYGTNAVRATIRDGDLDRGATDQLSLNDQQVGYLVVNDDDVAGPVHSGFTGAGRTLAGATFTNFNIASGLVVTGLVNDAGSGVYGGTSNTFALSRNGTPVDSGSLTAGFSNGGNGSLSNTFAYGIIGTPGTYTLSVFSVDFDIDRPGDSLSTTSFFTFVVVDPPEAPGLAVTPLTLTYHVMMGAAASNQTFTVNNIGTGSLIYTNEQTYDAGASGWFTATPTVHTNGTLGSRIHTGAVTVASIGSAGTYIATNRVAGNQTNAAQDVVVTLVLTNIPDPTAQTATADGQEMVRLAWTKNANFDVMIVHQAGSAPGTPAQNTAYALGAAIPGGGTVIYKGSVGALEHVVSQGTPHHYTFFSYSGNYYSTGVTANATTLTYGTGELIEDFAYTNDVTFDGRSGGQGWTNVWTATAPNVAVDIDISSNDFATFQADWPAEYGNRAVLRTTNSSDYTLARNFPGITTGKVYVASLYRREFNEAADGKYSGIRLLSGATEQAFFGELGGAANDDRFGVNSSGQNPYGAADSFPAFTDYLIIGRYDFDSDVFAAIYYTSAQTVPNVEPTFFISVTNNAVTRIDGVGLLAGASSGWNGNVHFDEIRVAQSWSDLLRLTGGPYATNYVIGTTNQVFDAQVNAGTFPVVMTLRAGSGVETTNTIPPYYKPNFDLYNPNGVQILTDFVFSAFAYEVGGQTVVASNSSHTAAAASAVVLGTYTGRWSAIASNTLSTVNSSTLSNNTPIAFTVVDDDAAAPTPHNILSPESGVSRSMHVTSNTTAISASGSGTNITYTLRDSDLAAAAPANPLIFYFGAVDSGSGLARGNNTATTNSSLTIGGLGVVSNVFNWDATRSTVGTSGTGATNAWTWTGAMLTGEIDFLVTNTVSGVQGSNRVTVTWRDADSDRTSDQSSLVDYQHGWLVVTDDDSAAPTLQNFNLRSFPGTYVQQTVTVAELQSGSGWAITGRVSDAGSGINVNGTSTTQPNISPYFELWDPSGVMRLRQVFDTIPFANGGATTLSSLSSFTNTPIAVVNSGIWTARVVVADADNDRTSDRIITTNEFTFEVVVGASQANMIYAPTVLNVTSSYGVVAGDVNWPNIHVTNNGIGSMTYSASFSYSGASGWLGLAPSSSVTVANGASTTHVASINTAGLNPGTYAATVSLVGNQTNGTKTVTVNLTVIGYYANEIVDQFTNTAGSGLSGLTGGTGWNSAWSNSGGAYSLDAGNLAIPVNYPTNAGNKICADSSTEPLAFRNFTAFSTGKVFAAVSIRKTDSAHGGYAGLSLMNGSAEQAFAGKLFGQEWFGLDVGGSTVASTFGIYGNSTYLIVLVHDFETDITYGQVYNPGDTVPTTEPGSWRVSLTQAVAQVTGIRLGGKDVATLCFDEIRVSSSWEGLLNRFSGQPTLHPTGLNFTNVTTSSMTVRWNNGNGGARIVVAREGSPVTFSPIDGSNYTANSDFPLAVNLGSGNKIIYNGSANNVNLSGLTSETNYFFAIYEYNGSGGSVDYLTNATVLTGSRWTLKTEPAEGVTNLNAYAVSDTTISNTWTATGGSPLSDGYIIARRNGSSPVFVPQDGVGYTNNQFVGSDQVVVVTNGTYETYLHTGLSSCDEYQFVIYNFRVNPASGDTYNYYTATSATAVASTLCEAPTLQASNIVFSLVDTNRITLSWENGNGEGRIVVVRGTNAVNQLPVDGTTYTANSVFGAGSNLGGGNYVAYSGTGSTVTVSGLIPGTTYHFRVFEFNGSGSGIDYATNTATANPRSTATAAFGLVEEKFGYGNWENMSGKSGGTGWTNNWATGGGLIESSDGNFPRFGAYPTDSGTVAGFMDMNNSVSIDGKRTLTRSFPGMTSGRMYLSLKVSDNHSLGLNDYLGVNLLNAGSVTGFFGKAYGVADRRLSLEHNGATRTNMIDGGNSGYQINSGENYLLVCMYDFDTKEFKLAAYTTNEIAHAIPEKELGWRVEMENVFINRIDGMQFIASDNDQIVSLDHIRIGPSWESVMWNLPDNWHEDFGPVPTLVYIGTNYGPAAYSQVITNLSDAELRSAQNIDFAVRWESSTGVFITNNVAAMAVTNIGSPNGRVNPNWDPLAVGVDSNRFNLDKFFTNYFGYSGANVITTYHKAAFNITNIDFDVLYFVTVSAENQPGGTTVTAPNGAEAVPVNRALTINEPLRFYVYDDDTNRPVRGAGSMVVMTNGFTAPNQAADDLRRYLVTDGSLASVGMDVSLNAYDAYSGIQRSTIGTVDTNMSLTIANFITNDVAGFNATRSSAGTQASSATNVWSFSSSNFTYWVVTALWGGDGSAALGQDLDVWSTIPDADEDRVNDQSMLTNEFFGYIRLSDDDTAAPIVTNITYGVGTVNNRPFYVATNGFSAGSDQAIRGTYTRRENTGADTVFSVTDAELAAPTAYGVEFVFGVRDDHSGISRSTSGTTNDVMSFSIGSNLVSGVVTGFNVTLSSTSAGPGVLQTNVWTFNNGFFSENVITTLMAITDSGTSSIVRVTVPDADNDRVNDRSTLNSQNVGHLKVYDDDANGPTMGNVDVSESMGGENILITSFETSQGWPSGGFGSTVATNVTDSFGTWYTEGVLHTSLDPKNTGTRRLGFRTNDFFTPWIQLPPVTNPGTFFMYAARVSGGSGVPYLQLEVSNTATHVWDSYGSNAVNSTTYNQLTWNLDLVGSNILIRVRRVDPAGVDRSQVYADDFSLTARSTWISTNSIRINWIAATDDYSGVDEYRLVNPSMSATAPAMTNDGLQVNAALTTQVASILGHQGIITGYIFAIDNDADRSNDRAMGNIAPIVVRVDTNPPPVSPSARASDAANDYLFDNGIDESTEIKVEWAPPGTNMAQAAGWRQSDSAALSPWDTYQITFYEVADETGAPLGGSVTTVLTRSSLGWSNVLNNFAFTNLVLSNLNFDAYYSIHIQARDEAGNIGPATNVIGNTDRFIVTQGVNRVDLDLQVFWKGVEGRDYDVLYADSTSGFYTGMSNKWLFMQYTNRPVMYDTGSVARARPGNLTNNTYRFYRVSRTDRWQTNRAPRVGSVEIYVTKALELNPGENWYSTFFLPDTSTVAYVFNTNLLPSANNFADATKISWFGASSGGNTNTQNGVATAVVWLASSGEWQWHIGGVGSANDKLVPPNQGFLIELPTNAAPQSLVMIGLLPTQDVVQVIGGGSVASNNIHILSYNVPVREYLTNMGFRGSGFVGNNNGSLADEIRILDNNPTNGLSQGSLVNPKARIRLRSDQTTWQYYSAPTDPTVSTDPRFFVIEPDDSVVVVRRNAGTMTWTNRVFFTPPTKNFTP